MQQCNCNNKNSWRTDRWAGKRSGAVRKHQDSFLGRITGEMTATVEEELVVHSSIKGRRFSCTGARVYDERDVEGWVIQAFLPNCCLHCINLFYQDKVIKHYSRRIFFLNVWSREMCSFGRSIFRSVFYFSDFGVPGRMFVRSTRV